MNYRNKEACQAVARAIATTSTKPVMLMEVCGGHTVALQRYGIPSLLPPTIQLVSGPGCPVCVTHIRFIDYAIALSHLDKVTIATFGDLIRVPGSRSTLEQAKAQGRGRRGCGGDGFVRARTHGNAQTGADDGEKNRQFSYRKRAGQNHGLSPDALPAVGHH